jgi:hypothetical protein
MKIIFKQIKKLAFLSVLAVLFTLSVSCTNSKPEITYGFIQSVLYNSDEGPQEHFSFFILPHDDDGLENLDELFLYNDREQLRWQIKSNEWISYMQEGRTWIGTRSITIRDGALPRGVYRAVLFNKGGEKTERIFTFDSNVRYAFPRLEISGGAYTVISEWPVNRLVGYDSSGNYSAVVELSSMTGSVADLKFPSNVRSAALWSDDPNNYCSAFTNVVAVNN